VCVLCVCVCDYMSCIMVYKKELESYGRHVGMCCAEVRLTDILRGGAGGFFCADLSTLVWSCAHSI